MRFDQVIAQFSSGQPDELPIIVPEHWGQGRAVFGGMAAALAIQHALNIVPDEMLLRSVSVSFVAPLNAGSAIVRRRVLRRGSSVIQMHIEILQQDQTMLVMLASFGSARNSNYQLEGVKVPIWPDDSVQVLPKHGPAPEFTTHFDYHIQCGQLPFSNGQYRTLGGKIRFAENFHAKITYPLLLALIDAWPPVSLTLLSAPAAASSLTWTVEFIEDASRFGTEEWWSYLANIEFAADGYHHIEAKLWRPDGKLAAISRQTVTVFA
jgi:acyl-CoA thioesterase